MVTGRGWWPGWLIAIISLANGWPELSQGCCQCDNAQTHDGRVGEVLRHSRQGGECGADCTPSSDLCRPSWTDCRNSGCSFCQLNKDRAEIPILAAAASADRLVAMASIIISPNSWRYAVGQPPRCLGFSAVLGIRRLYHGGVAGGIRGGSVLSNRPVQKAVRSNINGRVFCTRPLETNQLYFAD